VAFIDPGAGVKPLACPALRRVCPLWRICRLVLSSLQMLVNRFDVRLQEALAIDLTVSQGCCSAGIDEGGSTKFNDAIAVPALYAPPDTIKKVAFFPSRRPSGLPFT
jgi:hypothetical protein